MSGVFITFEGTEGSGKSTQIQRLAQRWRARGRVVRTLREPGGTPIGEEIRHTLQHSDRNQAMTPEAELLLINASRAQLVREMIRPALAGGEIVLCDRFYDSTVAYQGYGRELELRLVRIMIDFAVGATRPDLTFFLRLPLVLSEQRRQARRRQPGTPRDRMEEADRNFFARVERGYEAIATAEPQRVRVLDATRSIEALSDQIWGHTTALIDGATTH
jgi:dTMP kinase